MENKTSHNPLCPGKESFLFDTKELDQESYRSLVGRRARHLLNSDLTAVKTEECRHKLEKEISDYYEKIDQEANFLPAKFLDQGAKRSDAVCRIVVKDSRGIRGSGTGFLISPGLIMTNHHVLPSLEEATVSIAQFGFEEDETMVNVPLEGDRFYLSNKYLDFSIVACNKEAVANIQPIQLLRDPAKLISKERVNIIQHPAGRKKEVVLHRNNVTRIKDRVIRYRTDTEPGSSGSPVFNNDWELVALHHAGWQEDGNRATNEGIRISAIISYLLKLLRNKTEQREELIQILDTIPDCSPYLGFFDVFGVEDPKGTEIELPDYKGTAEFGDIGFWNIEHFNNNICNNRIKDVADVMSRLSMDILGLTEVEEGAMNRLTKELRLRGNNTDFALLDTQGRQDIALLYDADTTKVQIRMDFEEKYKTQLEAKTRTGKKAFPRYPLFAECSIKHPKGNPVKFLMVVVHFKAFGDSQSKARRQLASEKLAEIIKDYRESKKSLPVVLGGDFNERLDNNILSSLTDTPDLFTLTADDATTSAISYVGQSHRSLIDHILITKDLKPGDIDSDDAAIIRLDQTVQNFVRDVSDHVPIVFRIVLRKEPLDIEPEKPQVSTLEIPEGSHNMRVTFN